MTKSRDAPCFCLSLRGGHQLLPAGSVVTSLRLRLGAADKKLDSDGGYYNVIFIRAETKSLAAV